MNLEQSKHVAMHNNRAKISTERLKHISSITITGNSNLYLVNSIANELGYELSEFIRLGVIDNAKQ